MRNFFVNSGVLLASFFVFFLAAEAGIRMFSENVDFFTTQNFVSVRVSLLTSTYPSAFDPELGHIPRPGFSEAYNPWNKRVTLSAYGVRSNGNGRPPEPGARRAVLAVGDSFVFGDEVSDHETWPAHLEARLGRAVINAGVFGYGFDQTVLRAERMIDKFEIDTLLVGLIPDDIVRTEFSVRTGAAKPYFVVEEGELVRRNDPVPDIRPKTVDIGWLRRTFGHSYFLNWAMHRLSMYEWWYVGHWKKERAHSQGFEVSCLLARRLADLGRERNTAVVLVAQYPLNHLIEPLPELSKGELVLARSFLDCARAAGLEVLDLYRPLRDRHDRNPAMVSSYFNGINGHMTDEGNRFVADEITRYLARRRGGYVRAAPGRADPRAH